MVPPAAPVANTQDGAASRARAKKAANKRSRKERKKNGGGSGAASQNAMYKVTMTGPVFAQNLAHIHYLRKQGFEIDSMVKVDTSQ